MAYDPTTFVDDNQPAISASQLNKLGLGLKTTADTADTALQLANQASSGLVGKVLLDSFTGANDDAKLTAAMAYAAAQTYKPTIALTNRAYNFSLQRNPYTGFRLQGPLQSMSNSELSDANMVCRVNLSTNGPWLYLTGTVQENYIGGAAFIGTSSTTFLGSNTPGSLWSMSHMRDVSFKGFKTVLGTQTGKLGFSCVLIDGWFQMQGTYNGGIHIGGSDSLLWNDGALIDAVPAYNQAGNAAGQYHFWFDSMDNTQIGRLYITAEGPWGGIRVTGSPYNSGVPSNLGMLAFVGGTFEGRSASLPCYGSTLRVEGGIVRVRDAYIARAMSSPNSMGHSPADAGAVHVTDGGLLLDGCIYDRYTGQSEDSPFVYQSGGVVRVFNTFTATKGGVWTGKPRVKSVGGTLYTDTSVTVI